MAWFLPDSPCISLEQYLVITLMWLGKPIYSWAVCTLWLLAQLFVFPIVKIAFVCLLVFHVHHQFISMLSPRTVSSLSMFKHFMYPISSYWRHSSKAFWPSIWTCVLWAFETADIVIFIISLYHHPGESCWILSFLDVLSFSFGVFPSFWWGKSFTNFLEKSALNPCRCENLILFLHLL